MKKELEVAFTNIDGALAVLNINRASHDQLRNDLNLIGKTITDLENKLKEPIKIEK